MINHGKEGGGHPCDDVRVPNNLINCIARPQRHCMDFINPQWRYIELALLGIADSSQAFCHPIGITGFCLNFHGVHLFHDFEVVYRPSLRISDVMNIDPLTAGIDELLHLDPALTCGPSGSQYTEEYAFWSRVSLVNV